MNDAGMDGASVAMEVEGQVEGHVSSATNSSSAAPPLEFSPEMLRIYYGRLFPYDLMFRWLSYGNDPNADSANPHIVKDYFVRREWSFTIEDDIYIRYQCFRDGSELEAAVQKRQPHKIDIGAIFTAPPKDHNTIKAEHFRTVERELVFDIDLTDYDDIRVCCSGAKICSKCWPFMSMAMTVMDTILKVDFGFKHVAWFYSGRRGVHCWVCDTQARQLSNEARSAVVNYSTIVAASESSNKSVNISQPICPMVQRAYETLEPYFVRYIIAESGQQLLTDKTRYTKLLTTMPNDDIRSELLHRWNNSTCVEDCTAQERWEEIIQRTSPPTSRDASQAKRSKKMNYSALELWRYETVLSQCYPRLDANVSKMQNHLLKSPFCVHPKTGRVCVPINDFDEFDPFSVPTLRVLCSEMDSYGDTANSTGTKTHLQRYIDQFEASFMQPLAKAVRREARARAEAVSAAIGEF